MATAKEHIAEILKRQPDNSSYDEIVRELAFDARVLGALLNNVTSHSPDYYYQYQYGAYYKSYRAAEEEEEIGA
jgi:hypothetical protein